MSIIASTNPATNQIIKEYTLNTDTEVKKKILLAHNTFLSWQTTSFDHRATLMRNAASILDKNKIRYAETMTIEMGKTYLSAIAEVEKCAWVCNYYAANSEIFLRDEEVDTDASKSLIVYKPLGIVLAIMPWNYPFWQVFRFAAPALMAGNIGILKHASNVPGCAICIQEVFEEAGFPKHAFTSILIKSDQVEKVIKNDLIKACTLTGSGPAGQAVATASGGNIKKTVLELGGNDPYIVLEDADIELAAEQCAMSRLLNAGQSCIGAKRFIVVEEIYEEFLAIFKKKMENAQMGDPMQAVDLGPMARVDLRNEVHNQVLESVEKGAELILGGHIPNHEGAYYPPTILVNVKPGMPAYEDEIFGPVASVIKVKNQIEAIKVANDSKFGLGACVFTQDLVKGEDIAKNHLQAGCCFVNAFVKSDPRLPFGGIKESGYGRELSHFGIKEFVNIKTVWVA
jgi:succinate-semialdehyde dehydrogenase/glutarate-semialdehyde dehydrogenase